jgi:hypothetical protein
MPAKGLCIAEIRNPVAARPQSHFHLMLVVLARLGPAARNEALTIRTADPYPVEAVGDDAL